MNVAGVKITKNTVVGVSVGTLATIIVFIWTVSGIGRPLFAADLERIETKIDTYQATTAIQILSIRREALQSELRTAKRDARADPTNAHAADDVDKIESDIADIEARILCHRIERCEVESEI